MAAAARRLLAVMEVHLDELPVAAEDELGYDRHLLSPVFHAFHAVITRPRQLDEARRG